MIGLLARKWASRGLRTRLSRQFVLCLTSPAR